MSKTKDYVCVNCGKPAAALYRTYGPSVLKLNKCKSCKVFVDKYVEYDNVIIMIDAVLISKEAQRHVILNIDFKSYWKLFIILTLLETYGVWRNDSLFNIAINSLCDIRTNATVNSTYLNIPINKTLPDHWKHKCKGWIYEERMDNSDLFIWEKDFYILFTSTLAGIIAFLSTVHLVMKVMRPVLPSHHEVSITRILKAFCMANVSMLFTLPMLVWGNADTSAETRTIHYALVFAYSFVVFFSTFTVLYEAPVITTLVSLIMSYAVKYLTTFHVTLFLRGLQI
ncbi:arv1-like family domain-containing protein [Phthorimaea operculella]|nr:arv1-like family domain-containing protein [Phthorimaea operculella]